MSRMTLLTFYDKPCLGIRYLSTIAREQGHEVSLIFVKEEVLSEIEEDGVPDDSGYVYEGFYNGRFMGFGYEVDSWTEHELQLLMAQIDRTNPDIIGLSTRSFFTKFGKPVMRLLRQKFPGIPFVCGGYGPSLDPEWFLNWADYVAFGEYDSSILNLLDTMEGKGSIKDCPGLIFRDHDGCLVRNGISVMGNKLDALPFPDWDDDNKYLIQYDRVVPGPRFQNHEHYLIMGGRGCPGTCSYCQAWMWRHVYREAYGLDIAKYRRRSVANILEEIKKAKSQGARFIKFLDPILCGPEAWLEDLQRGYSTEIRLPFEANCDPRFTDKRSLKKLVDMGLKVTCAGIQSGSVRVRREIFKRAVSDQAVLDFCNSLDQYGVLYSIHLIGWNPYETIDDYEKGLQLLLNLRTGVDLKIFRLQFFPGSDLTAIRDRLKATGLQEEVHSYYAYLFSFIVNNNESREFALAVHRGEKSIEGRLAQLIARKEDMIVPTSHSRVTNSMVFPADSPRNRLKAYGFSERKAKEILMDYGKEDVITILNSVEDKLEAEDAQSEIRFKFLEKGFKPVPGEISTTSS